MIKYPIEQRWTQPNTSDLFGSVFLTKNISFDDEGYLTLAGSPRSYYSELSDSQFRNIAAHIQDGPTRILDVTWGHGFDVWFRPLEKEPHKITSSPGPYGNIQSDAVWFDNKLCVSSSSRVVYKDDSTWFDTNISLSSTGGGQHPLIHFVSQNKLAVANLNTVLLYSTMSATPTLDITLTIPNNFFITGMTYFNQNLFIATRHKNGEKACVFTWNGSSTQYQNVYELDSHIVHDIEAFDNTVYLLQSNGQLSYFTGTGFAMAGSFPLFQTPYTTTDIQNIHIYKNSLKANGDVLYVSFASNEAPFDGTNPSGVWCFDPKVGLYHKYSFTTNEVRRRYIQTTEVNTTNNTITWTNHELLTGTEIVYSNQITKLEPLKERTIYFVIRVDDNTIKLATTKQNAMDNISIDLTTTGHNLQSLIAFPNYDFGASKSNRPMAIKTLFSLNDELYGTDIVWGAELRERNNFSLKSFGGTVSEMVNSYGWYISPKVSSYNTIDTYNNFVLKHTKLKEDEKITIKFRTKDEDEYGLNNQFGADGFINWTSKNTFLVKNLQDNISFEKWANAEVGDEVEILEGSGGGLVAHITNIELSSGDYAVSIDEDHEYFTSGESSAIFRKWKKLAVIDYANSSDVYTNQLDTQGKFIQFKVVMSGKKIKISEMAIDNKTLLPSAR